MKLKGVREEVVENYFSLNENGIDQRTYCNNNGWEKLRKLKLEKLMNPQMYH